jgi:hypothetical protein
MPATEQLRRITVKLVDRRKSGQSTKTTNEDMAIPYGTHIMLREATVGFLYLLNVLAS